MGTRSLTVVHDEDDKEIVVMYRQMDGYPTGHGEELAEFLRGMRIVNGISPGDTGKFANGMDCLAAQLVMHFKAGCKMEYSPHFAGNIYLRPGGTRDYGEEYVYHVSCKDGGLRMRVTSGPMTAFGGGGESEGTWVDRFEGTPEEFDGEKLEE
jgi:hypothetical protein